MADLRLTRKIARGDAHAEGLLRSFYEQDVVGVVELALAGDRVPSTVDRVFEVAVSHLRVGVRPDALRTWILVLAREIALRESSEEAGEVARPADDWRLLVFERTLLHLHRRCGIPLDELADALSVDRTRLELDFIRLERRFVDMIALRVLVDERGGCEALEAGATGSLIPLYELGREHARSCPICSARVAERAAVTDMLGYPADHAIQPPAAPRRPSPARPLPGGPSPSRPSPARDRSPVGRRGLVAGAVIAALAAAVAVGVLVTSRSSSSSSSSAPFSPPTQSTSSKPTVSDVSPPRPPRSVRVASEQSVVVGRPILLVSWSAASDDRGVVGYDVYVDGVRQGRSSRTTLTVDGLPCGRTVSVSVTALDAAGNQSPGTSVLGTTPACASKPK